MGTRNLTCVFHDGKYKLAQYGQWDGYPAGQGATALKFLHSGYDRQRFIAQLDSALEPTAEKIKAMYVAAGADQESADSGMVPYDIAEKFSAAHPNLSRDTGAEILGMLATSTGPIMLHLKIGFAADSLFCEWCYVIDFDKNTFEVFKGFNKDPLDADARFYNLTEGRENPEYHPVKLVKSWPLDALPDEAAFLECFKNDDDC